MFNAEDMGEDKVTLTRAKALRPDDWATVPLRRERSEEGKGDWVLVGGGRLVSAGF